MPRAKKIVPRTRLWGFRVWKRIRKIATAEKCIVAKAKRQRAKKRFIFEI